MHRAGRAQAVDKMGLQAHMDPGSVLPRSVVPDSTKALKFTEVNPSVGGIPNPVPRSGLHDKECVPDNWGLKNYPTEP